MTLECLASNPFKTLRSIRITSTSTALLSVCWERLSKFLIMNQRINYWSLSVTTSLLTISCVLKTVFRSFWKFKKIGRPCPKEWRGLICSETYAKKIRLKKNLLNQILNFWNFCKPDSETLASHTPWSVG